jgi:hypothetical protein
VAQGIGPEFKPHYCKKKKKERKKGDSMLYTLESSFKEQSLVKLITT